MPRYCVSIEGAIVLVYLDAADEDEAERTATDWFASLDHDIIIDGCDVNVELDEDED